MAERKERRDWSVEDESASESFSGLQELEQEAKAVAIWRASKTGEQQNKPWKPAQPANFQPFKPAQPAKIVMHEPK